MTRFLPLLLTPFLAATSPIAEVICAPSDEMQDRIRHQFGEELAGRGIRDADSVLEVWASDRGTWTLTIAYATGRRCIVASGEHWDSPLPFNPA